MSAERTVSLILCPRCRMTLVSPVFERDALLKQHFRYGCNRRPVPTEAADETDAVAVAAPRGLAG